MKQSGHSALGRRTEFVRFLIRSEIIAGEVPTLPPSLMGMVLKVFHSQVTMEQGPSGEGGCSLLRQELFRILLKLKLR